MSDTATAAVTAEVEHTDDDHAHEHPSDWIYVKVALVLAAITALEVFTYFESVVDWGDALIPALMIMMVVKFFLVAMFFMHLKFDNPIYWKFFVGGILLAGGVYIATLATFSYFGA